MLFIFLTAGTMAIGGNGDSGRDSYISAIVSLIFVIPLFYIYFRPFNIYKKENCFEIIQKVYGNTFGCIINFFNAMCVLMVGVVSFSRLTLFIKTVSLNKTSLYLIGLFIAITTIYAVYSGFEVLARFSEIVSIVIIIFLFLFTFISYSMLNYENITPIMENGIKPVLSAAYSIAATPFMESYALILLVSQSSKRKDMQKTVILAGIFSAITMSIILLRNLLILGYPAIESLYYPSYLAISLITLGEFFQRQEVAVSIVFLIADIFKVSVLSIFICQYINFTAKTKQYKNYSVAIGLLIFALSGITFTNTFELFRFFSVYEYFLTIPFAVIPIITFVLCKIKKKTVTLK